MPEAPYYTRAFSPLPGRCFRLGAHHGEAGSMHCPEPVAWRGSWRAPNGRRYRVEACEGHRPAPVEGSGTTAWCRRGGRQGGAALFGGSALGPGG